jgi:hypothetical protein
MSAFFCAQYYCVVQIKWRRGPWRWGIPVRVSAGRIIDQAERFNEGQRSGSLAFFVYCAVGGLGDGAFGVEIFKETALKSL